MTARTVRQQFQCGSHRFSIQYDLMLWYTWPIYLLISRMLAAGWERTIPRIGKFPCHAFCQSTLHVSRRNGGAKRNASSAFGAGVVVDGAGTLAEPGVGANRLVDKAFGASHGDGQRQSLRQAGRDGGGVGAAGAVGMRRGYARRREFVPVDP